MKYDAAEVTCLKQASISVRKTQRKFLAIVAGFGAHEGIHGFVSRIFLSAL
jgi:hypothetical protein